MKFYQTFRVQLSFTAFYIEFSSYKMSSKRVLTYLKRGQDIVLAPFGQCVVSSFFKDYTEQNEVEIHCDLAPQGLLLSKKDQKCSRDSVILRHPPFCPMLHLSQELKEKVKSQSHIGVSVAVAVILESSDTKVLLTRRPPHMRTFPNVWVPPGGGSEESETIIETGLRELKEETGLDIGNYSMKFATPLCLWESVYPALLAKGDPKRHTMVVYLHVFVEKTSQDLIQDIRLDPQETNAYMWLDLKEVNYTCDYSLSLNKDDSIMVHELKNDSVNVVKVVKNYDILRADLPTTSGTFDVERISTGTRFALEQFYARKENSARL